MRRLVLSLLIPLLVLLLVAPASAALPSPGSTFTSPPVTQQQMTALPQTVPVAFGAVPNRYTDVDPATIFDLNGDLTGDVQIGATTVTAKNGAQVQLLDPPVLSLDQIQAAPLSGYAATAPTQLSRVYMVKLASGYAKFLLMQASPKVTIWFHAGKTTTSTLTADGAGSHAVLSWGALPDAAAGYNVYRYEFMDNNAYQVTLLNDFTVQGTTFTDETALNRYYVYVVMAIKADGTFGSATTAAACSIQSQQRSLMVSLATGTAKLDGTAVTVDAAPVIRKGRLMVPATLLTNAGVKVTYAAATGQVTLVRKLDNVTYTLVMTIDTPDYTWNGSAYKADVPPYLAGSVVMVPLRVVAPALGYGATFNSTDRTATIQWFE